MMTMIRKIEEFITTFIVACSVLTISPLVLVSSIAIWCTCDRVPYSQCVVISLLILGYPFVAIPLLIRAPRAIISSLIDIIYQEYRTHTEELKKQIRAKS